MATVWQLLRLGAGAIKNSVYALPNNDETLECLQWVCREIVEGGGDASICEALFVDGLTTEAVRGLFQNACNEDYAQIADDARKLLSELPDGEVVPADRRDVIRTGVTRLKRRLLEVVTIDFFGASGRETAEGLIQGIEVRMEPVALTTSGCGRVETGELQGRTWVTRRGIHVDRMACVWFIRRFVAAHARFKFVPPNGDQPIPGDLRFDMFEAEFTDPALQAAEIVHDIDLKDGKFGREETPGITHLVAGIALVHRDDEVRLERASAVFGDLDEYFKRTS